MEKKFGNHNAGDLNGQIIHENELFWTIDLRNDGAAHDVITLTEKLPPHIQAHRIVYGNSTLVLNESGSFELENTQATELDEGFVVSNNNGNIAVKAEITTNAETHQQTLKMTLKPYGEEKGSVLNPYPNDQYNSNLNVKVYCKIDEDLLATAKNGKLELGWLKNELDVQYDATLYHKEQKTELTYEEETVKPSNVEKGFRVKGGDQQARITYTIDINQSGAELNPASSTLTLTDKLTYDVLGWAGEYPYLRNVTLDEGSFRLYEALKDENGNPILVVDESGKGHLLRGAEIEKYLWKMEFTETEEGNKTYQYPPDRKSVV